MHINIFTIANMHIGIIINIIFINISILNIEYIIE